MIAHASRAHSRYGASGAHRWMACPGSVRASEGVADRPSAAAEQGTRAHELLERALRGDPTWATTKPVLMDEEEWRETVPAVQVAVEYVADLREEHPDGMLRIEHRFELPSVVAPGHVFGTNDIAFFVPSLRLLYVIDYKHGIGHFVDVKGNRQLRFYALGAVNDWVDFYVETVVCVIVQPRVTWASPVREEWLHANDIARFAEEIELAIAATLDPDAPLVPGEEQCQWCAVRTTCPARMQLALRTIGDEFGDIRQVASDALPPVGDLPVERLADIMSRKDLIEGWLRDVEQEAMRRCRAGERVPGLKLVEAQGRRQWEGDVAATAEALAGITGRPAGDFVVAKLRGITEVEADVKRAAREAAPKGRAKDAQKEALDRFAFLTTKKSSGNLVLASEDDPRPAIDRTRDSFGDVALIPHMTDGEQ